jgi:AraC-like DNA-binding protein
MIAAVAPDGRNGYTRGMQQAASSDPQNSRRTLVDTGLVVAEELVARPERPPRGDTERRQLVVTYAGAFDYQVGCSTDWVDPSRLLLASPGESFVDHHVVPGTGHASVVLTPGDGVLEEQWGDEGVRSARRVMAGSARVQMLTQLLRRADGPLAAEELGIAILAEGRTEGRRLGMIDQRCVRRARAVLHDCPDGRISLSDIAAGLGVTPIHLTQSFKRSEGMPLYRYQTLLRLGRALDRLPEREDITDLAFELGWSSHSHFTAAFRSEFGITPSNYRSRARGSGAD